MHNADDLTLNYIASKLEGEHLEKAMKKAGLVYIQKQVASKHGTFTRGYWVKASEAKEHHENNGTKMVDTKNATMNSKGTYHKARREMHEKIIKNVVYQSAKPSHGQKPVAILMGGGSASGKSTMRNAVIEKELAKRGIKAGTVDADEIKKEIPEFESLKKTHPEDAARLVHEESADVGAEMINRLVKDKRHFIYDGTAKSPEKYEKLVKKLKKAGYEVHMYVADVPLEVAKERSDKRAERTGRKVPHSIIEGSHRGVPKTVEAIKDKIDSYQVFDNTNELKLIASNKHIDPEMYSKFLEKGGIKYSAKANA